ncbi:hypothetical protein [Leekyejoonella antrihumi]|uniref:Uncharacterized protein n=1 Tax=Leekyejoonella antrihumi TaxID=1660198 RepID=A0A563E1G9_9MICO|nr:hypothetical protein [Leekyejoonella antrihumi]TWP36367.1 hypothetical protein FGL98_10430 [Leekyejoonella antrihumi]
MTTATAEPRTWMTLADVARLAQVQRPVVSMWRSRHADFPQPTAKRSGHPVFDPASVGSWLQRTGRGNNPDALADAVAFAHPADDVAPQTLSALLTLSAITGEQLTDLGVDYARVLATEVDPDDRFLRRELEALPADAAQTLAYADSLADAAYSPARALDTLIEARLRHDGGSGRRTAVSSELCALVTATARALAVALGMEPLTLVDASRGGTNLVPAAAIDGEDSATVILGDHPGEWVRLSQQRIRAHGIVTETCATDDGLPVLDGPALVMSQLPDGPRPLMTDRQILHEVGELTLRMSDRQWALVVAPASALVDRLRDREAERDRDDILRAGRLRLALRLPKGLLPHGGRRQLALWLLGSAHPDVPATQRWTVVGDLTDVPLDESVRDEIATDAVAALGDVHVVRGHAFRHARLVSAPALVAARGDLVTAAPAPVSPATPTPAQTVLEVERLQAAAGLTGRLVRPTGAAADAVPMTITLGRAMQAGQVRLLPGHRIRPRDVQAADPDALGGVVLIGPEELTGASAWGSRRIDRLRLHCDYPAAALTEPGDVVFCTGRRVSAQVDRRGGSVVCSPARILRITGGGEPRGALVPDVLAADLVRQPVAAKAYRTWTVRLVPTSQRAALTTSVDDLARQRDDLQRRLTALTALQQTLTDGVAVGAVELVSATGEPLTKDNAMTAKGE